MISKPVERTVRIAWRGAALLFAGLLGTAPAMAALTDAPEVRRFVADVAARHGMTESEVAQVVNQAQVLDRVLKAISRPAERKPWYQYRPIFVTDSRVEGGVRFWEENRDVLARAEATFGVPAEIMVAIIGVETRYGRHKGPYRVLDSLATLGFHYPKRSKFFRSELEQFLVLAREEGLDPLVVKGSYAGAMGLPQFISSSYRRYAVDFDGDGQRDLLGNVADAIGSVGNYLKAHGWRSGEGVALPARVQGTGYKAILEQGLKPHMAVARMGEQGVVVDGAQARSGKAALMEFETEQGPEYWAGFQNFYAITRYNHSQLYALAVFQLAESIRERYRGERGT